MSERERKRLQKFENGDIRRSEGRSNTGLLLKTPSSMFFASLKLQGLLLYLVTSYVSSILLSVYCYSSCIMPILSVLLRNFRIAKGNEMRENWDFGLFLTEDWLLSLKRAMQMLFLAMEACNFRV